MKQFSFYTIVCLLIISSCSKETNHPLVSTACDMQEYDVAFEIVPGSLICFSDDVMLEVISLNNELCPCVAVCVWGGEVSANFKWTVDGVVTEQHHSFHPNAENKNLPDGITASHSEEPYTIEEDCSESNPFPAVAKVELVVSR